MRFYEISDIKEDAEWWNPLTWWQLVKDPKFNPDITPMKKGYERMKKKMSTDPEYAKKILKGKRKTPKKRLDDIIL
jgi:hypothetical protein